METLFQKLTISKLNKEIIFFSIFINFMRGTYILNIRTFDIKRLFARVLDIKNFYALNSV